MPSMPSTLRRAAATAAAGGGGGGGRCRPSSAPSAHSTRSGRSGRSGMRFVPRTPRQKEFYDLLRAEHPSIVVATGPAGTAKTYGAVTVGLEKLVAGDVDRLVLTRPAVGADEELGFLPGSLEDKMKAWLLPIMDALKVSMSPADVKNLLSGGQVEICSLAHMRGRTFRHAYVVVDECQNTTPAQMLMLLTRIGEGSKFVFTGDPMQHDRRCGRGSGLVDFLTRFHDGADIERGFDAVYPFSMLGVAVGDEAETVQTSSNPHQHQNQHQNQALTDHVHVFTFGNEDIQRHPSIVEVLRMYENE